MRSVPKREPSFSPVQLSAVSPVPLRLLPPQRQPLLSPAQAAPAPERPVSPASPPAAPESTSKRRRPRKYHPAVYAPFHLHAIGAWEGPPQLFPPPGVPGGASAPPEVSGGSVPAHKASGKMRILRQPARSARQRRQVSRFLPYSPFLTGKNSGIGCFTIPVANLIFKHRPGKVRHNFNRIRRNHSPILICPEAKKRRRMQNPPAFGIGID